MYKRGLLQKDLEEAICRDSPEILEDYPDDARGPACLVLGWIGVARPLHVVVGYGSTLDSGAEDPGLPEDDGWREMVVVTIYEPDEFHRYNPRVRRRP